MAYHHGHQESRKGHSAHDKKHDKVHHHGPHHKRHAGNQDIGSATPGLDDSSATNITEAAAATAELAALEMKATKETETAAREARAAAKTARMQAAQEKKAAKFKAIQEKADAKRATEEKASDDAAKALRVAAAADAIDAAAAAAAVTAAAATAAEAATAAIAAAAAADAAAEAEAAAAAAQTADSKAEDAADPAAAEPNANAGTAPAMAEDHDEQQAFVTARAALAAAKEQAVLDELEEQKMQDVARESLILLTPDPMSPTPSRPLLDDGPSIATKVMAAAATVATAAAATPVEQEQEPIPIVRVSVEVAAPLEEVTVQIFKKKEDPLGLGVTHTSSGTYITAIKRDGPSYMPFFKKKIHLDDGLRVKTVNGTDVTASKAAVAAAFKTAGDSAKIVFEKDPVSYTEAAEQAEADKARAKAAAAEKMQKRKAAEAVHRQQMLQQYAKKAGAMAATAGIRSPATTRSKSPNPATMPTKRAKSPAPKVTKPVPTFEELLAASDWAAAQDPASGKPYYYNRKTNATAWTPPDLRPEPEPQPSPSSTLAVPGAGASRARSRSPSGRAPSKSPARSPATSHGDLTVVINKGANPLGLVMSELKPGDGVYVTGIKPTGAAAAVFAKRNIGTDAGLKFKTVDGKRAATKKDVIALFKASRSTVKIQFSLDPEGCAAVAAVAPAVAASPAPATATESSAESSADAGGSGSAKAKKGKKTLPSPRAASPSKATTEVVTVVIHKGVHPVGLTLLDGAASKRCYVSVIKAHGAAEPVLAKKRRGVDDGLRFTKIDGKGAATKNEVAGLLKSAGPVVKLEFSLDPEGYQAAVAAAPPAATSPKKERKAVSAPSGDGSKAPKATSTVGAKTGAASAKLDEVVVIIHKGSISLGITLVEPEPGKGTWLDKIKATGAAAPVFKKKNLSSATGLRFKTVNGTACSTKKEVGAALKLVGTTAKLVFIKDPEGHAAATAPHGASNPQPRFSLDEERQSSGASRSGGSSAETHVTPGLSMSIAVLDASDDGTPVVAMPGANSASSLGTSDAVANLRLASGALQGHLNTSRDRSAELERRLKLAAVSNVALTQMRQRLDVADSQLAVGGTSAGAMDAQRAEEKAVLERHAKLEMHAKAGLIVKSRWLDAEARVLKRLRAEHSSNMESAFANLVVDFKGVLENLKHVEVVNEVRPTWEFHHLNREVGHLSAQRRKFSLYGAQRV